MGWYFQLEHANIVAYLTLPQGKHPEVKHADLTNFPKFSALAWRIFFL